MIFQEDRSKHNKKTITFVSNLFANLNGILLLFHLFWPEIWLQIHLNNFTQTSAVILKSAVFVGKTYVAFWCSIKKVSYYIQYNTVWFMHVWKGKILQATVF